MSELVALGVFCFQGASNIQMRCLFQMRKDARASLKLVGSAGTRTRCVHLGFKPQNPLVHGGPTGEQTITVSRETHEAHEAQGMQVIML
jgi:hypothetical protein